MNQKKDSTNLQFFSETHLEKMQTEISRVLWLFKCQRISFQQASRKLHQAEQDMPNFYYRALAKINQAEMSLRDHKRYGSEIERSSGQCLTGQTSNAIGSFLDSCRLYKVGGIDLRHLRRQRRLCVSLMKTDVKSLSKDLHDSVRDAIRIKKRIANPERIEEIPGCENVSAKDLMIQRVSEQS